MRGEGFPARALPCPRQRAPGTPLVEQATCQANPRAQLRAEFAAPAREASARGERCEPGTATASDLCAMRNRAPFCGAGDDARHRRAVRTIALARTREKCVRKWFIVSAVGRDRPGIVADLAQLVFDCEANLEDSRMTLLGNEFAAILLCSGAGAGSRAAARARARGGSSGRTGSPCSSARSRASRGPPCPRPARASSAIETQGMDRAGIVARICRTLADHHVNIADLQLALAAVAVGRGAVPHERAGRSARLARSARAREGARGARRAARASKSSLAPA